MNGKTEKTQISSNFVSLALSLGIGGGSNLSWQSSARGESRFDQNGWCKEHEDFVTS